MPYFASAKLRGEEALRAKLDEFGKELKPLTTETAVDASIEILKDYAADYRYVSRAEAYPMAPAGPGWFSDKQRRYVMSRIASGEITIPYQRTGSLQDAWTRAGSGARSRITNYSRSAVYAMHNERQSAHERLVGWKKVQVVIEDNFDRIMDIVREAVAKLTK